MQFSTVGACLLGLLSLQNGGELLYALPSIWNSIPLALRQTGALQLICVSFQLYATILIKQWVSVSFKVLNGRSGLWFS